MPNFKFCSHAEAKFQILKEHGFLITKKQVINTIKEYDSKEKGKDNRVVFQKIFDEDHVLREICEKNNGKIVVVTFYPGRRSYYEN